MERAPQQRPANLRVVALASAAALAVVLPLAAATAGPAPQGAPDAPGSPEGRSGRPGGAAGPESGAQGSHGGAAGSASDVVGIEDVVGDVAGHVTGTSACGPEVTAPAGAKAQTCVLTRGEDSWARTYYSNTTGMPVSVVLTLMRADGTTTVTHCEGGPEDTRSVCETPREPLPGALSADGGGWSSAARPADARGTRTSQASGGYRKARGGRTAGRRGDRAAGGEGPRAADTAVAEMASAKGRLLLRAGSNTPAPDGHWSGHGSARSLATGDAPATGLLEP